MTVTGSSSFLCFLLRWLRLWPDDLIQIWDQNVFNCQLDYMFSYNSTINATTVFRGPRNFEPSRGIWPLQRNFHVSAEFHGIRGNSAERPNSVILYCCCNCNCDSQSIQTATEACRFQWRVLTFTLLTYLFCYLLDLCRWPVIHIYYRLITASKSAQWL